MFLVVLVCFVVVMLLWLLAMLGVGGTSVPANASGWLAFFACLCLGVIVFISRGP